MKPEAMKLSGSNNTSLPSQQNNNSTLVDMLSQASMQPLQMETNINPFQMMNNNPASMNQNRNDFLPQLHQSANVQNQATLSALLQEQQQLNNLLLMQNRFAFPHEAAQSAMNDQSNNNNAAAFLSFGSASKAIGPPVGLLPPTISPLGSGAQALPFSSGGFSSAPFDGQQYYGSVGVSPSPAAVTTSDFQYPSVNDSNRVNLANGTINTNTTTNFLNQYNYQGGT
jgi:hypothetical protein